MTEIINHTDGTKQNETDPSSLETPEAKGLRHFLQFTRSNEEFENLLRMLELNVDSEIMGNHQPLDEMLVKQSVLFNKAFLYYFGGGSKSEFTDKNFLMALRSQAQSADVLNLVRTHRIRKEQIDIFRANEFSRTQTQRLKNLTLIEKNAERSHRSAYEYFTEPSDDGK